MKTIKASRYILIVDLVCLMTISIPGFSQNVPCRDWYYIEDSNGNKIKDKCKEGWNENDIGQKNGKYFYNKENGTPYVIAFYKNDVLNGRYVLYSYKDIALLDSGRYINGKKSGKWVHDGNCYVTYREGKPFGTGVRKYKELQLKGFYESDGAFTGTMLIHNKMSEVHALDQRRQLYTPIDLPDWMFESADPRFVNVFEYTMPFPLETCDDCIDNYPMELIEKIFAHYSKKEFVVLETTVYKGDVVGAESFKVWVNGKLVAFPELN
jgi:hypothetical protein